MKSSYIELGKNFLHNLDSYLYYFNIFIGKSLALWSTHSYCI